MALMAMSIAFSSARRMFLYPGSLYDMWISLLGLYTPDPTMSPSICPSEFLVGGGIWGIVLDGGVLFMGVCFQVLQYLML